MVRRVGFFAVHGFISKFAKGVFEPGEVKILTGAFDDAWARLKASKAPFAAEEYAAAARTILAKRIIKLAKEGERDRSKLATDGLLYLSQQKMTRSPPGDGVA